MRFENALLIDDDPIYNMIHTRILHHSQLVTKTESVSSGKDGLVYLSGFFQRHGCLPSLILLDIDMPVMDGFQFLDALQKMRWPGVEHIAMVMVSSSTHPQDRAKALQYGIMHYLLKPVELHTMIFTLQQLLKQAKMN